MTPQELTALVFNILITIGKAVGAVPGVGGSHHYQAMMKSLHESHEKSTEPKETENPAGGPTPSSNPPPDDL